MDEKRRSLWKGNPSSDNKEESTRRLSIKIFFSFLSARHWISIWVVQNVKDFYLVERFPWFPQPWCLLCSPWNYTTLLISFVWYPVVSQNNLQHRNIHTHTHTHIYVKLAIVFKGNLRALYSIATTLRCRGGHYSFPWIAQLYPWYVPYDAEC